MADNTIQYGYGPLITKNIAGYPVYGTTGGGGGGGGMVASADSGAVLEAQTTEAALPLAAASINDYVVPSPVGDYVVPSAGGGTGIGIYAPGYLISGPGGIFGELAMFSVPIRW